MNRSFRTVGQIFLIIFLINISVKGQDIHYSQFYNSPLNLNPANTGVFNGDERFMASYKSQARAVPVPWTTFSGQYDRKFYLGNSDNSFISGGVLFNYDKQGLSRLNLTNINFLGSYTRIINKRNLITGGLGLGFATRGLSLTSLSWDRQWDGDAYDPTLPSGENTDMDRVSFLENSIGLNYRYQITSRTNFDFGLGVYHFIEPKVAFFQADDVKLPRRLNLNFRGTYEVHPKLDIQGHALGQFQGAYDEYLFGLLGKIYIQEQRGKEFNLHVGLGLRTTKIADKATNTLIPTIAIEFNRYYGSFSYDVQSFDHDGTRVNLGGPELHFRYIITHVKPLKQFKICPIF